MPSKGTKGLNNTEYVLQNCFDFYNKETDPQYFESKFTSKRNNFKLDERTYKSLCKEGLLLMRQALLNGEAINLSNRMGYIQVIKKKANIKVYTNRVNSIVDWKVTKQFGKKILNFNEHTNDYIYKIKWFKLTCNARNKGIYSFIPNRLFKRELAFYIKTLKKDYSEPVTYLR